MKAMRKLFVTISLTILLLIVPICVAAVNSSAEPDYSGEDVMQISNYDAVTKTTTTETVTVSELKARNVELMNQRGLTEKDVMCGKNPMADSSVSIGGEDVAPQSLIGQYVQTRVNVNAYPYSAVLLLWVSFDLNNDGAADVWGTGSGYMVGSKVMVTAGHNFFYKDLNGAIYPILECRIYPKHASTTISGVRDDYYHPKSWTYSTVFANSYNVEHDWLVATLFSALGDDHGFLSVRNPDASLSNVTATVLGYPAETTSKKYYQYKSIGPLDSYTTKRLFYRMDTEKGNSGGPIIILGHQVVGIHTRGTSSGNSGTRIFEGLYTIINNRNLQA